ncbi:MAG: hypothetical protein EON61_26980 [Alphaproteobacteria bacterium]|nr:MAG: hypothetical protein EON61_26980 [Alphaproteobacteria bacterium]
MRVAIAAALSSAAVLLSGGAQAELKASAPDALVIQVRAEVLLDRDDAWARLLDVSSWWKSSHTYSGNADNMNIDAVAGGCWCELWSGGEVEHGRVVAVMPEEMIRFNAPLGPLQEMGVSTALTFTLSAGSKPNTTSVVVDFKVSGSSLSKLDKLGVVIDGVISEQVASYAAGK